MFVENLIFNGHSCLFGWGGGCVDVAWDFCILTNPDGEISVEQGKHIRFINKYIVIQQYLQNEVKPNNFSL